MAQRQKRYTHDRGMSLCGRRGETGKNEGVGDPLTEEYNINIPLVASVATQTIDLPVLATNGVVFVTYLNTITPSTSGTTQEINIGITGNNTAFFTNQPTNATAPAVGGINVITAGEQITYNFVSADIDVYEAELFLRAVDFGA